MRPRKGRWGRIIAHHPYPAKLDETGHYATQEDFNWAWLGVRSQSFVPGYWVWVRFSDREWQFFRLLPSFGLPARVSA